MQCFWVVVVSTSQTCVSKLSDDLFIGNNTFKAPLIFQQTFCRDESVRCSCLSWEEIFTPSEVNRFPPHGVNSPMSPGELMNSRKGKKIRRANKQRSVWPQAVRCITDNTTKPNTACLYSTQKSPQLLQRWLIKKMVNSCFQVPWNLKDRATQRCLMLILLLVFEKCWEVLWEEPHRDVLKQLWTAKLFWATWPQEIFCIWKLYEP